MTSWRVGSRRGGRDLSPRGAIEVQSGHRRRHDQAVDPDVPPVLIESFVVDRLHENHLRADGSVHPTDDSRDVTRDMKCS